MNKLVSIIILNYNKKDDTIECIKSLKEQTYQNLEIIIIDNGSKYDSYLELREEINQLGKSIDLKLIRNNLNVYFAGGMNKGMKLAHGEYVSLLCEDIVVAPDFVEEMVKFLENHPDVGIIAPKIKVFQDKSRIWWAGSNVNIKKSAYVSINGSWISDPKNCQFSKISPTDYVPGGVCIFRKEIIKEIGLLDEIFFMYYEEVDWNFRAKKKGYKIYYVPTTIIYHKVTQFICDRASLLKQYFLNRNKQILVWKQIKLTDVLIFYLNFSFKNLKMILGALLHKRFYLAYLLSYSFFQGFRIGIKRRSNRSCSKILIKDYNFIRRIQKQI